MIAVLIPVLARPQNAAKVAASLAAATTVPHRLVFIVSPDDTEQRRACEDVACSQTQTTVLVAGWHPGSGDYAKKLQLAYDLTHEPFVFTGADDLDFQPGWDVAALAAIDSGPFGVAGTNDLANPTVKRGLHSTHSLVRRSYVDGMGATFDRKPGLLLHDGYDHQWVDTELVAVAIDRGEFVFCRDSRVRHAHPFFDRTVARDATYEKALAKGVEDRRLFEARRRAWARGAVAA